MSYSLGNKGLLNRTNRTNRPLNFGSMMEDAMAQAEAELLAAAEAAASAEVAEETAKAKGQAYTPPAKTYPSTPTPSTIPASGGIFNIVMIGLAALIFLMPSKK
jgi:hypothetical protein